MSGDEADLVHLCKLAAERMGAYVERIGQRRADKAGQDQGAPDLLCYVNGQVLPCELKRAKDRETHTPCGRLSLAQIVAIERREAQGVRTYVIDSVDGFVAAVNEARRPRGVTRSSR